MKAFVTTDKLIAKAQAGHEPTLLEPENGAEAT
jgi:hypothetical protein